MNMINGHTNCLENRFFLIIAFCTIFLAVSCRNVIHELIPPSDSGIHSFSVENADRMRYVAAETDSTDITITVPAGTDVTALLPIIESGDKSTVLPVTLPYIHRAFPSADLMSLAVQMNASQKAGDLGNWMLNFIRENKDFSVPPLDEPVDFTQPVMFCVIAGRGNYKLYTVTVVPEKQENPAEPDTPFPSEPDNPDEPGTPDEPSVPPQAECEKKILSFVVNEPKQTKPSVITEDTVTFYLNAGADSSAVYPVITVSEGAGILPLTQEYLLRLFSYTELISFYSGYSTATDANAFISAAVKKLDADKIAKIMEADLLLPIDFSGLNSLFGVPFAVVGADKSVHIYSISGSTAEDTAALIAFAVTKIRNPGLMGDADVSFSGDAVTITATYPVEYQNFRLIPDIVIDGDTWEITGGTLRTEDVGASGEETECTAGLKKAVYLVPGDTEPVGKEYTATLTVRRGEAAASYTLRLIYKEDKDTIRSITDFRFLRLRNPLIKTTSMASISKNEDTGFISAAVMYEGDEPPYDLVADFYSPGTCTVEHTVQESGKSRNSFRYDVQILCTSKNKLFCRLYTVHVTFIKVKTAEAVLNYFAFPKHLNPALSQSATGLIDESSGTVYVNAKYHTPEKPAHLVPEFAATGTVSVNSILQSSGYSTQDFSRSVWYSVRDQNDWSSDSRTYRISVNWEQDEQSACAITGFGFSTADNPSLEKDVSARINERAGTIYALLPKDAGKSSLAPYFSAKGTVTIGDAEQTSGSSRQDFSDEVVYTVTSANGLYTKQYAVSVQEAGPVIYVNAAAIGRNNGTCWQDAYITLDAAFEQAQAYGDAHKEIWIAYNGGEAYAPLSDAYRTNGLPLTANTTVRGGFVGTETDADERRTKKRSIEFDVNAVEDAKSGKMRTIPVRHEADVCAVQTKLFQPNTTEDSHLFEIHDEAPSGEIVFDGIDMELNSRSASLLAFSNGKQLSLTLQGCTVRADSIGYRYTYSDYQYHFNTALINNSELIVNTLNAKTLEASGSDFVKPSYSSNSDNELSINTEKSAASLSLQYCTFSNADSSMKTKLTLGNTWATAQINSCSFDNMSFTNSYQNLCFTDCRYLSSTNANTNLWANEIICCELKNESSANNMKIILSKQCTITDSTIEGFTLDIHRDYDCNLRVNNSTFSKSSFNQLSIRDIEIEMNDTTMKETGSRLFYCNTAYDPSVTVRLTNSTFSNSAVSDCSKPYIYSNSENTFINIDSCTFNIENNFLETSTYSDSGEITLQNSQCIYPSKRNAQSITIIKAKGTIKLIGNTFKSKSHTLFYCNSNRYYLSSENSTTFTQNKIESRYTSFYAHRLNTFGSNQYDNFVRYEVSPFESGGTIDFSTEQIEIKEPLYNSDLKEITKKAAIFLYDGAICIKNDTKYKDFLCILELDNTSTAIVSGQDFSNSEYPAFEDMNKSYSAYYVRTAYPVRAYSNCSMELTGCTVKDDYAISIYSDSMLSATNSTISGDIYGSTNSTVELTNSTVTGAVSATNITVSENSKTGYINAPDGTVEVSGGSTVGDIRKANTITAENSNITGSMGSTDAHKTDITLSGVTVNGMIFNLGNNSSVHTSAYNGRRTEILGTDSNNNYSIYYSSNDCSGEISCTDTDMTGGIGRGDKITTKNAEIGGIISFGTNAEIEFSKSHIKYLHSSVNDAKACTITILGSTVERIFIGNEFREQSYLYTKSIDGTQTKINRVYIESDSQPHYIRNLNCNFSDTDFNGNNELENGFLIRSNNIIISNCTIQNYHIISDFKNRNSFSYNNVLLYALNKLEINNNTAFFNNHTEFYAPNDNVSSGYSGWISPINLKGRQIFINNVNFFNNKITSDRNYENIFISPVIEIVSDSTESSTIVSIEHSNFSNLTLPSTNIRNAAIDIYNESQSPSTKISNCNFVNNNVIDICIQSHIDGQGEVSISSCNTDKISNSLDLYYYSMQSILELLNNGYLKTDNTLPLWIK